MNVVTNDFTSFNISWGATVTGSESIGDYGVFLWRGETPTYDTASYTNIASGLASDYSYRDATVSGFRYHQWREIYYTAIPHELATITTLGDVPTPDAIDTDMDNQAREIIRREAYTLDPRYGGISTKILKRKTYGTHCTTCWDAVIQRQTTDNCQECWDTGWIGGYYPLLTQNAMLSSVVKRTNLLEWTEWQAGDRVMTLGPYPHMAPRDVAVDELDQRWVVKAVRSSQKGLYIINQNAHMRLLNRDHIIYDWAITW